VVAVGLLCARAAISRSDGSVSARSNCSSSVAVGHLSRPIRFSCAIAALHPSNIAPIKPSQVSQLLLRKASRAPQLPDALSERLLD
jgi:hypothetical protein